MEFVGVEPGAAAADLFGGHVLVVPAVSLGNVGQLACDLLLNTLQHELSTDLKVGLLRSRNVAPMVGHGAFDSSSGEMCSNLEVFRLAAHKVAVLQVRAPLVEGCSARFAEELVAWAQAVGFAKVYVLGGADASASFEKEVMRHELRFFVTSGVAAADVAAIAAKNIVKLGAAASATSAASAEAEAMQAVGAVALPLAKGGLARPLFAACEERGLPLVGLVLFCKEGDNVPEGCMMAAAAQTVVTFFDKPPAAWKPPQSWRFLDGPEPEPSLF